MASEQLTNIRKRLTYAKWHYIWAFRRLTEYVEYEAEAHGLTVRFVNPQSTSQRCSTCGFTHEDIRRTQESFSCRDCGYENHADYSDSYSAQMYFVAVLRWGRHRSAISRISSRVSSSPSP